MILKNENLNLSAIAESGQCFRWKELEDGTVEITAFSRVLLARQLAEDACDFDCGQREFDDIWRGYLDLDTDYGAVIRRIPKKDTYLRNAAAFGKGIRILRQDPFETLITFTISQRKNIPAIRQAVEKLCRAAGRRIPGTERFAFPEKEALASLSLEDLLACSLGYRAKYLYGQAQRFAKGEVTTEGLAACSDEKLKEELLSLLDAGTISLALIEGNVPKGKYGVKKYRTEDFCAVCSAAHTFAHGTPRQVRDLLSERLLLREPGSGTRSILEKSLSALGLAVSDFPSYLEVENMHILIRLLEQDMGISFLYRIAAREGLSSGVLREIPLSDFALQHDFSFVWDAGSIYAAREEALAGMLTLPETETSISPTAF